MAATLTPFPPSDQESETRIGETGYAAGLPSVGPLSPGDAFGPRYRILKLLGAGGMGVVYQAWDEELGDALALKVIRPEVVADPNSAGEVERRFKRELLLARQVTHRNVVRIHDLGEVSGIKYITMPFIEGENLAAKIARCGKLPVPEVLRIARQIASGLEAAHAAGVVHRDLKPENVMIDAGGEAIIMDFGISRSLSGTGTATAVGAVVGTLEYMSPEQGRGEGADHRSDIYSLGLILYDALGGRSRIGASGGSAVAELMSRVRQAPPPLRSVDPAVPQPVERILSRTLEPDPSRRYQTVGELVADLEALAPDGQAKIARRRGPSKFLVGASAALLTVLSVGTWLVVRLWPATVPATRDPVSVLIADFDNQARDPVFEGSLEQTLGIALEDAPFITSFPRVDAHRIGATLGRSDLDETTARLVAQREGIKVILAGSIAASSPGYSISVRAIDPFKGERLVEATQKARTKADVLQALGAAAATVRAGLGDTTPESARLAAIETVTASSLTAIRDYSIAQDLAIGGSDEEAIARYRRAIEQDPQFGRAYSGWGLSASKLGRLDEAAASYKRAFALSGRMTEREKYRTYGGYYLTVARDYEKAVEMYTKLVELYPADRAGHSNLALAHFYLLNFQKARDEGRKAIEIYRRNPQFRNNYALYAMYAGDFATAAAEARKVLELLPTFAKAYLPIAVAALVKGDARGAHHAYEKMAQTGAAGASRASIGLADLEMYFGRHANAIQALEMGIAADERTRSSVGMAAKLVALAEALLAGGKAAAAVEAATRATALAPIESVFVPASRVLLAAGREANALAMADDLGGRLQRQAKAHGKIIEGEIALARGQYVKAAEAYREAQKLADLWLARYGLGVAYVGAGLFPEALAELELCEKRRGEATAVFLDDVPSYRYLAALPYWLGRAREGVGMTASARVNYEAYLAIRRDAPNDPLSADARQRLASR